MREVQRIALGIVFVRRIDVDQLDREIGVDGRGSDVEMRNDIARDLYVARERLRLEHQHVGAIGERAAGVARAEQIFGLALVVTTGEHQRRPRSDRAADRRHRIGRIEIIG